MHTDLIDLESADLHFTAADSLWEPIVQQLGISKECQKLAVPQLTTMDRLEQIAERTNRVAQQRPSIESHVCLSVLRFFTLRDVAPERLLSASSLTRLIMLCDGDTAHAATEKQCANQPIQLSE